MLPNMLGDFIVKKFLKIASTAAIFLAATTANSAVFFVAHPDDAQLMMSGNLYSDIKGGYPTVVVVVTAGDDGNLMEADKFGKVAGRGYNSSNNPYYRTRLNAHEAAIANIANASRQNLPSEYFSSNIPAVEVVKIGNVKLYYLNLQDGQMENYRNTLPPSSEEIIDITGTNTYSLNSLRSLLGAIISRNNIGNPTVVANFPEYNLGFSKPGYNDNGEVALHGDHTDHTAVGKFVREALQGTYSCVYAAVYMGYGIQKTDKSLTSTQEDNQVGAYKVLHKTLEDQGNWSYNFFTHQHQVGAMDSFHQAFYGRQKWRADSGGGVCSFTQ